MLHCPEHHARTNDDNVHATSASIGQSTMHFQQGHGAVSGRGPKAHQTVVLTHAGQCFAVETCFSETSFFVNLQ